MVGRQLGEFYISPLRDELPRVHLRVASFLAHRRSLLRRVAMIAREERCCTPSSRSSVLNSSSYCRASRASSSRPQGLIPAEPRPTLSTSPVDINHFRRFHPVSPPLARPSGPCARPVPAHDSGGLRPDTGHWLTIPLERKVAG